MWNNCDPTKGPVTSHECYDDGTLRSTARGQVSSPSASYVIGVPVLLLDSTMCPSQAAPSHCSPIVGGRTKRCPAKEAGEARVGEVGSVVGDSTEADVSGDRKSPRTHP